MARRKKRDDDEQLTVIRTMRLTPRQAAELDATATEQDATWSDIARELMFRRSAARPNVGSRSEAAITKRQLEAAQHATDAAGNLLNQLARHANTTGELGPRLVAELAEALALVKRATELHIAAIMLVMAQ
jgi:hypothetical protein